MFVPAFYYDGKVEGRPNKFDLLIVEKDAKPSGSHLPIQEMWLLHHRG